LTIDKSGLVKKAQFLPVPSITPSAKPTPKPMLFSKQQTQELEVGKLA
jgi:hypothetical protein